MEGALTWGLIVPLPSHFLLRLKDGFNPPGQGLQTSVSSKSQMVIISSFVGCVPLSDSVLVTAAADHTWVNGPVIPYLQHRRQTIVPVPLPLTFTSVLSLSFPRSVLQWQLQ